MHRMILKLGLAIGVLVMLAASAQAASADVLVNGNSLRCLDVYQRATWDGANVDQWACNGASWQQWTFYYVGQNFGAPTYEVVNNNSGKCLDVYQRATWNGANVDQWACKGGAWQWWSVYWQGNDIVLVNANSGKCLDVYQRATWDGANVDQWSCNGGSWQEWGFTPPT